MKIQPVSAPEAIKQTTSNNTDARNRAIAALMGESAAPAAPKAASEPTPVPNPSQVSPEELSAVKAPTEAAPANEETTERSPSLNSEKTEDPEISSRLAQLVKREKAIRIKQQQAEQALKAKEAELAKREAELAEKFKVDQTQYISKQRLKENPLDVLAEAELSYDELTNQVLNAQPKNPRYEAYIQKLEAQIAQLVEKTNKVEKTYETQQQEAYQAAIKQIEKDATKLINSNPDYELIRNSGEIKEVVELIERTYKEDGELLSVQEAADLIEKELEERTIKFFEKTEKLKKRWAPKAPASVEAKPVQEQTPQKEQTQTMKTLTNTNSSTRQLSARERAILAMKGELKS